MKLISINPSTGEEISLYKEHSSREVMEMLDLASRSQQDWKNNRLSLKIEYLPTLSSLLKDRTKELAICMAEEMGKPISQGISEITKCASLCDYYYSNSVEFLKPQYIDTEATESYFLYEPLGVILGIMPWNFPFWQALRFCLPAMLAGNTVVLKHSSVCPLSGNTLQHVIEEAGFPKGVFRHLVGNYTVGEALAQAPVDAISITGSTRAGKRVAEIASQNLHKFILELGGSDPFVVLKDADVDKAAEIGVASRFLNNGQSCIAAKRFIVQEEVLEEFTKKFQEHVEKQIVGDPLDPKTTIGPLVRGNSREVIAKQISDSTSVGAKILTGGDAPSGTGFFFNPTVLTNVQPEMSVSREEVFGPVAPIISVKNPIQAIKIANDTEFGLGSSIWSEKYAIENNLAKDIDAGMVYINSMVISDPRVPFGGVKNSGIGRELSDYGIKEFVNVKSVIVN